MKKFFFGKVTSASPETSSQRVDERDELMDHLDGGDERAARASPPAKEGTEKQAGIGIVFQIARDGGWYIKSMDPDGAAADCKILQQGDCLVAVDGKSVHKTTAEYMSSKIFGKLGTPVGVKFRRNVVDADGACSFTWVAPVLTRGKPAHLPTPAGIGIVFKVGADKSMFVKAIGVDGPAALSGVVAIDDRLQLIDGKNVLGKPVTAVTPLLTGAFESKVDLAFLRKDANNEDIQVKVSLLRGKKASFQDDRGSAVQTGLRALSLEVPEGCMEGDEIEATDEETGLVVKVKVPPGAEGGTLLRVPIPTAAANEAGAGNANGAASSDPAELAKILNEIKEIEGTANFSYRGHTLKQLRPNRDGTCTIEDADSGEVIWHGRTEDWDGEVAGEGTAAKVGRIHTRYEASTPGPEQAAATQRSSSKSPPQGREKRSGSDPKEAMPQEAADMSVKDLKWALKWVNVDTSKMLEKADMVEALEEIHKKKRAGAHSKELFAGMTLDENVGGLQENSKESEGAPGVLYLSRSSAASHLSVPLEEPEGQQDVPILQMGLDFDSQKVLQVEDEATGVGSLQLGLDSAERQEHVPSLQMGVDSPEEKKEVPSLQLGMDSDEEDAPPRPPSFYPAIAQSAVGVAGGLRVVRAHAVVSRAGVTGCAPMVVLRKVVTPEKPASKDVDVSPFSPVKEVIDTFEKLVAM